ncbi:MAG: hypothetical protein ACOYB3_00665 [Azonexus sp.]
MTEEEAILHYLRTFAGQRVPFCKMLNVLARSMNGHDRVRFPASKAVISATWLRLRAKANQMIKAKVLKIHRRVGSRQTVRLNEAFVKKPFYR